MKKVIFLILALYAVSAFGYAMPETYNQIDVTTDGTFARNSIAYLFDPSANTMTDKSANARRNLQVPVLSPAELEIRTAEGGGSSTLKISNYNNSYIFAVDGVNDKIYKSVDGDTWAEVTPNVAVVDDEFTPHQVMLTLRNNRIMRIVPSAGSTYVPYYSDDNGTTWTVCTNTVGGGNYNTKTNIAAWGVGINHSTGTICMASYGSNSTSTISRSTDNGATWTLIVDGAADADHFHALAYHAGTNTWIFNTGDGGDDDFDYISTDDGLTFAKWGAFARARQYTKLLDVGHPTKILAGSDGNAKVFWIDMVTGDVSPLLWNWKTTPAANSTNQQYCWQIFEYAGLYYACNFDSGASGAREAVISVSSDLVNWRTYCRLNDNTLNGAFHFGGVWGGNIHLSATTNIVAANTWKHIVLSPARILNRQGILVEPACTNLVVSAAASDAETVTGWTNGGGHAAIAVDNTVKLHGTYSVKSEDASPAAGRIVSARFTTAARTEAVDYIGRFFIKGYASGNYGSSTSNDLYATNSTEGAPYSYFCVGTNRWQPVFTDVFTAPDNSTAGCSVIGFDTDTPAGVFQGKLWIDCVQYQTLPPSSWQIAGTDRVAETWSNALTLGTDWTFVFTVIPQFHSTQAGAANLFVCTFEKTDGTDYASVYWNITDKKWYVDATGDGSGEPAGTAATGFQWEQQMTFVIRRSAGQLRLSVHDGATWKHTSPTADHTAASTGSVTWQVGDNAGANLMPELLTDIYYFSSMAMSDSEVENFAWLPEIESNMGYRSRYDFN